MCKFIPIVFTMMLLFFTRTDCFETDTINSTISTPTNTTTTLPSNDSTFESHLATIFGKLPNDASLSLFDSYHLCLETISLLLDLFLDADRLGTDKMHDFLVKHFTAFKSDTALLQAVTGLQANLTVNYAREMSALELTFSSLLHMLKHSNWSESAFDDPLRKRVKQDLCALIVDGSITKRTSMADLPTLYKILVKVSMKKLMEDTLMKMLGNKTRAGDDVLAARVRRSVMDSKEFIRKVMKRKRKGKRVSLPRNLPSEESTKQSLKNDIPDWNIDSDSRIELPNQDGRRDRTTPEQISTAKSLETSTVELSTTLTNLPLLTDVSAPSTNQLSIGLESKMKPTIPQGTTPATVVRKVVEGSDLLASSDSDLSEEYESSEELGREEAPAWPQYGLENARDTDKDDHGNYSKGYWPFVHKIRPTSPFPMIVQIVSNFGENCTGTLLAPTWVLTTQRCVANRVRFTVFDPVCQCNHIRAHKHVHPDDVTVYNEAQRPSTFTGPDLIKVIRKVDIALLKLEQVWKRALWKFAVLPAAAVSGDLAQKFRTCMAVGIDYSSKTLFRKQTLPLLPYSRFCSLRPSFCKMHGMVRSFTYTLYYLGGRGMCESNEGSPLFCWNGYQMMQYGINMRSTESCGMARSGYNQYTRLDRHLSWIRYNIND